jgi:YD repeat-containing protein
MVAVISSGNLGVYTANGSTRGAPGPNGSEQNPQQIYANTSTGNLVIQQRDELLAALGLDLSLVRTYNSQGLMDDDNGDNWRLGIHQRVYGLTGTVNTAGSTVRKVFGDGADILYTYNTTLARYVSTDGDGAHDTLAWNTGTSQWTWTDGSDRNTETYDSTGRLISARDPDGNPVSYIYTGALLTRVDFVGDGVPANLQQVFLDYTGTNLTQIRVTSGGATQTLTRYGYDASNRLTTVTVDLSPGDNVIADGNTYTTTYTYDGTSKRVASITQKDRTTIAFTYELAGSIYRVKTYTDGEGRTTTFSYATTPTAGWAAAVELDTATAAALDPQVAFDARGNGFAVWRTGSDVIVRRYDKATNTWATQLAALDALTTNVAKVSLSVDAAGNALIAWIQGAAGAEAAYAKRYDAAANTWSAVQTLDANVVSTASLGTSINGSFAAVTWLQANNAYVSRLTGTAWVARELVETSANAASVPAVAVDALGNVNAVWQQNKGSETFGSVYTNRYNVATSTWTSAELDVVTVAALGPQIAFDAAGNGFAAWRTGSDVIVRRFDRATGTWESQMPALDALTTTVAKVSLSVDASGNAVVAWIQGAAGAEAAYGRRYDAATNTWGAVQALDANVVSTASLATHISGGYAAVTWLQAGNAYVARSNGVWSARELVESSANAATVPAVAIDAQGNITGIWQQNKSAETFGSVYASRYSSGVQRTDVTDALGQTTTYVRDASGRLTAVFSPVTGGQRIETRYAYDASGNITSIVEDPSGLNRVTTFQYDGNGNLMLSRDNIGNTVSRTYSTNNQVLTESRYITPDPDGAGAGAATNPLTTRYAYDGENHLRFIISADGRVTEYVYNTAGQRTAELTYAAAPYDISALAATTALTEAQLITWVGTQDKTKLERINCTYDFRGNISTVTRYTTTDSTGAGVAANSSRLQYVYDQRGRLLQKIDALGTGNTPNPANSNLSYSSTFTYDGLGRLLAASEWLTASTTAASATQYLATGGTRTTVNQYDDVNNRIVTTAANGLVMTTVYDRNGAVTSSVNGIAGNTSALGTSTYAYDSAGRLRITTDPTGVRQHVLYDGASRQIATIDGDGTLTEYVYNNADQVIKTVTYADRLTAATLATLIDAQSKPTNVSLATLKAALPTTVGRASDQVSRNVFDGAGRLVYTLDPTGAVTQLFYDGLGRVTDTVAYVNRVTIAAGVNELRPVSAQLVAGNAVTTRGFTNTSGTITVASLNVSGTSDRRPRNFYDNEGHLAGTLDAAGYLIEYVYDAAGNLNRQIAYANITASANWNLGTLSQLRPATDTEIVTDYERDIVTYFYYDGQGRQIGALDGEGYLTESLYDVDGQVTQSIRYNRVLAYNANFTTLKSMIVATDQRMTTLYTYDGAGRVSTKTERQGTGSAFADVVTNYVYDAADRLISSTRAAGTTETRTAQAQYDALGRVIKELSAEGTAALIGGMAAATAWDRYGITYTYDLAGRRTSATSKSYNAAGTLLTTNVSYFYYNEDNQLRFTVNRLLVDGQDRGEVTELTYNALGQVVNRVVYAARLTTTSIQTLITSGGGLLSALPAAVSTALGSVADATKDSRTTYTYTLRGEVATSVTAEGSTITSIYNAFGDLTTQTDKLDATRNIQHGYTYDKRGLLTDTVWDASGVNRTEHYDYDAFGRRYRVADQVGNIVKSEYDRLGRTIAVVDALNKRQTTTYDAFSRTLTIVDANNNTTTYQYTDNTRTVQVTSSKGLATVVQNRHDQTVTMTDEGGAITTTVYNKDGQVTDVTIATGTSDASTTRYVYDSTGRTLTVIEGYGTTATIIGGLTVGGPRETQYVYDVAGRRVEENVKRAQVANASGVVADTDLRTYYRYDGKGNLSRKIDAAGNSTWYVYDKDDRLVQIIDALGGVTQTDYNHAGLAIATRRYANTTAIPTGDVAAKAVITATVNDRYEQTVYDTLGRAMYQIQNLVINSQNRALVTRLDYDRNGNVIRKTAYATDIAQGTFTLPSSVSVASTGNDRVAYTAYDANNRATFSIDALGTVTQYQYDSNGNVIQHTTYATQLTPAQLSSLTGAVRLNNNGATGIQAWSSTTASTTITLPPNTGADRTTRYWYDGVNRLRFTLDAEGYLTETRYDAVARTKTDIVYANSQTIAANAPTASIAPVGAAADQTTVTLFDAAGRVRRVFDASYNHAAGGYGNITPPGGVYEEFTYDAVGNKTSFRNKKNDVWNYEYDANRRLIKEKTPEVMVTTVASSGSGSTVSLSSSSTARRIETAITYDQLGNVKSRSEDAGVGGQPRVTRYEYDALGRQTRTIFPQVGVYNASTDLVEDQVLSSTVNYDALGNAFSGVDTAGSASYKIFDQLGRLKLEIDAERYVTKYGYDVFGNQESITRFANPTASVPVNGYSEAAVVITPSASHDRTLVKTYDRLNRVTEIRQPAVHTFTPAQTGSGGTEISIPPGATPTTTYSYNAFGQVSSQSEAIGGGQFAVTHFYFDKLGNRRFVVDALGYITEDRYDAVGNVSTHIEYARAATTSWTPSQSVPAADATSGADRRTEMTYDKLNRKLSEAQVGIVSHAHTSTPNTAPAVGPSSATATYEYDAVGNQVRTAINGVSSYTYYDKLGRVIAQAGPTRDRGDGTQITPFKLMKLDAHGNVVEIREYANSLSVFDSSSYVAPVDAGTADPTNLDRISRYRYDTLNRVIHSEDARGADEFAAYTRRGDIAKQWQHVSNAGVAADAADNTSETLVNIFEYDRTGRQTRLWEKVGSGTGTLVATASTFNAFGEVIYRGLLDGSANAGQQEYFDYDRAGRLWRTNSGDGVDKVYLYNLQGKSTATIVASRATDVATVDLKSIASPDAAYNLHASKQVRQETVYDALGRTTAQRTVTYTAVRTGNPTSESGLFIYWETPADSAATQTLGYRVAGSGGAYTPLAITPLTTTGALQEFGALRGTSISHLALGNYEFQLTTVSPSGTKISEGAFSVAAQSPLLIAPRAIYTSGYFGTAVDLLGGTSILVYGIPLGAPSVEAYAVVDGLLVQVQSGYDPYYGAHGFTGYRLNWEPLAIGTYPFMVVARDASGVITHCTTGTFATSSIPDDPYSYFRWNTGLTLDTPSAYSALIDEGRGVISWIAPNDATSVAFKHKPRNSGAWSAPLSVNSSSAASHSVDLSALSTGDYDYEIIYTRADGRYLVVGAGVVTVGDATSVGTVTGANTGDYLHDIMLSTDGDFLYTRAAQTIEVLTASGWQTFNLAGSSTKPEHTWFDVDSLPNGQSYAFRYTSQGYTELGIQNEVGGGTFTKNSSGVISLTPNPIVTTVGMTGAEGRFLRWSASSNAPAGLTAEVKYKLQGTTSWAGLDAGTLTASAVGSNFEVDVSALLRDGAYDYQIVYKLPNGTYSGISTGTFTKQYRNARSSVSADTTTIHNAVSLVSASRTQSFDRWGNVLSVAEYANNAATATLETKNTYNHLNQVVTSSRKANTESEFSLVGKNYYDASGLLIAVQDGRLFINKLQYNTAGQLTKEIHADAGVRRYFDSPDTPSENHGVKRFVYNAFGEKVQITDEEGFITRNGYDQTGNLTHVTREINLGGFTTSNPYDYRYDIANGNLQHQSYTFDEAGRRISETIHNAAVGGVGGHSLTTYDWYDLQGNLNKHRTNNGRITTYSYDALNRKIGEVNANSDRQTWTYDYFGRQMSHTDLAGMTTAYLHNSETGLITGQRSQLGENIRYSYDAKGQLTFIADRGLAASGLVGVNRSTAMGYDRLGRRVREETMIDGVLHQRTFTDYDQYGRINKVIDSTYEVQYWYDANDNRTHTQYRYRERNGDISTKDLWYAYDSMDRVTVSQGVNINGVIQADLVADANGTQGLEIKYDSKGNRLGVNQYGRTIVIYNDLFGFGGPHGVFGTPGIERLRYTYDGLGRLLSTDHITPDGIIGADIPFQVDARAYDGASRVTSHWTFQDLGQGGRHGPRHNYFHYNGDGQLTYQQHNSQHAGHEWSLYDFSYDGAGNLLAYRTNVINHYITRNIFAYRKSDTYQETANHYYAEVIALTNPGSNTTRRTYNVNGELVSFRDDLDRNKDRYFANNQAGQALSVVYGNLGDVQSVAVNNYFRSALSQSQLIGGGATGASLNRFGFSAGHLVGNIFTHGGGTFTNFDVNLRIDDQPGQTPTIVVVLSGDTLRSIATRVLGDGSLWYLIAEENGLQSGPDDALQANSTLRVPNRVVSLSNDATTFKPFNALDAIGYTTPAYNLQPVPQPRSLKCKTFAKVLGKVVGLIVGAIITIVSYGTATVGAAAADAGISNAVEQTVLAIGNGYYDWGGVWSGLREGLKYESRANVKAILVGGALGVPPFESQLLYREHRSKGYWASKPGEATLGEHGAFYGPAVGFPDHFDPSAPLIAAGAAAVTSYLGGGGAWWSPALGAVGGYSVNYGLSKALGNDVHFSWRDVAVAVVAADASAGAGMLGSLLSDGSKFWSGVAANTASVGVRALSGGKMSGAEIIVDVFGNPLANSIVDSLKPKPYTGVGQAEFDEMMRNVEAAYQTSQDEFAALFDADYQRFMNQERYDADEYWSNRSIERELREGLGAENQALVDRYRRGISAPDIPMETFDQPYLQFDEATINAGIADMARSRSPVASWNAHFAAHGGNSRPNVKEDIASLLKFTIESPLGLAENVLAIGSGVGSMILGGWASMYDVGFGEYVQQELTYQPRTESGQIIGFGLQLTMSPVATGLGHTRSYLGDFGASISGDNAIVASAFYTAPDALLAFLAPEVRASFRSAGGELASGGKWLANEFRDPIYSAAESFITATGGRTYVVSPNARMRANAQASGGAYLNPETNQIAVAQAVEADHIVSKNWIKENPLFKPLTDESKSWILNHPINTQPLPRMYNASKQAKSASDWRTVQGRPLDSTYVDNAIVREEFIKTFLEYQMKVHGRGK